MNKAANKLPTQAAINLEGLKAAVLATVPVRDDLGYTCNLSLPSTDEGVRFDKFLGAFGLDTLFVSMESQVDEGHPAYAVYEAGEGCAPWTPEAPQGQGWHLAEVYDTEDGAYALFVRETPPPVRVSRREARAALALPSLETSGDQAPSVPVIVIDGHKGEEAIRRYVRTMARTQVLNQWLADVYCNELRERFTREAFASSSAVDQREAEFRANNNIADLWRSGKERHAHFWPEKYGAEFLEIFPAEHCKVTESLIASLHGAITPPALSTADAAPQLVERKALSVSDKGAVVGALADPCRNCDGSGVDCDAADDGRSIAVECAGCNGTGKAHGKSEAVAREPQAGDPHIRIGELLRIYDEKGGDWCRIAREVESRTIAALAAPAVVASFQQRVQPWMLTCFGEMIAGDREERNHRFLEEALELVQSTGCTASEAHQLVDYVYGRPAGEPAQEAGGVMVTLAALCLANGLDMHDAAEVELARIWTKVEAIRAKQAAKPKHSPLPEATASNPTQSTANSSQTEGAAVGAVPADLIEKIAQGWDGCMYDAPGETVDIGADIRRTAALAVASPSNTVESHQIATPAGQQPVAWRTHHDVPMLFPTEKEAAEYCVDDEAPEPLYVAATTAAPAAQPDANKRLLADIEAKAREIYEGWSSLQGWVPWVENGNSDRQDDARRLARKALDAALAQQAAPAATGEQS